MRPVSICCVQITGTACLEATYTDDSKSGHWDTGAGFPGSGSGANTRTVQNPIKTLYDLFQTPKHCLNVMF